jgi:hypothetical protein
VAKAPIGLVKKINTHKVATKPKQQVQEENSDDGEVFQKMVMPKKGATPRKAIAAKRTQPSWEILYDDEDEDVEITKAANTATALKSSHFKYLSRFPADGKTPEKKRKSAKDNSTDDDVDSPFQTPHQTRTAKKPASGRQML